MKQLQEISPEQLQSYAGKPVSLSIKIASYLKWTVFGEIASSTLWALAGLAPAYLLAWATQMIADGSPLIWIVGAIFLIVMIRSLEYLFEANVMYFFALRGSKATLTARRILTQNVLHNSYDYFTRNFSGQISSRINQIARDVNALIGETTLIATGALLKIALTFVALLAAEPIFSLIFLLWVVGMAFSLRGRIQDCQKASVKESAVEGQAGGKMTDLITNFSTLFNLGGTKQELKQINKTFHRQAAAHYYSGKQDTKLLMTRTFWQFFLGISFVVATALLAILEEIPASKMILVYALWTYCIDIAWITWAVSRVVNAYGALKEQTKNLLQPYSVVEKNDAQDLPMAGAQIELKNIHFGYDANKSVFEGLSCAIPNHQHIGIVGKSGAGKSTLMSLLLRFYDVQQGAVTINGMDVREVSFESLRALSAVVPQDPTLFHRSIADNLRFVKPEAADEEIFTACKKAHIHDFIVSQTKGYETLVGERGIKLSVGQRQRIAIARALLKDSPLVIFDEATSALDSESEAAIQEAIGTQFQGKTLIVIAHRLSTLKTMDRIIVLDEGKIAEDGTPGELLDNEGGLFRRFWDLQSEGFIADYTHPPMNP